MTATDNGGNSRVVVLPVTVSVPFSSDNNPTRSSFIRTDQGPTGAVYDQARKLVFVTIEALNQVTVFSSEDGHRVATIPVMYPSGIDESWDGMAVYVVSPFSTAITTIDPNTFQVVAQTQLPSGLTGFQIATLNNGAAVVVPAINGGGFAQAYRWTPSSGAFAALGQSVLYFNPVMTRSADRSKVLFYGTDSAGVTAALYDEASESFTGPTRLYGVEYMALSPDGSRVTGLSSQGSPTIFCDDQFNVVGSIQSDLFPIYGIIYSLDGGRVYAVGVDQFAGNVVTVIDTETYSALGLVPGFTLQSTPLFSGEWDKAFTIDETGILFGTDVLGVAALDVGTPGFVSLPLSSGSLFQPGLVSESSPTAITLGGAQLSQSLSYNVYFSASPASPQTKAGTNVVVQSSNSMTVTAPEGLPSGAANVTLARSDGWFQVMPDAVTVGPTVLNIDPNAGSLQGGDSIQIIGYGLSGSGVQVTIGGKAATVTNVLPAISEQIFPKEVLTVTTPSGSSGNADVVVETPEGSTKVSSGFQYLNSVQLYPSPGALDALVYDQRRQRLYISNRDHNRVEIFELAARSYLSPIAVGNQPTGVALTPDGALLAVVNSGDGTISVIDPARSQVVATWQAMTASDGGSSSFALSTAAITGHRVFVAVYNTSVLGGGSVHVINLDTGQISCSGYSWCVNGTDVAGPTQAVMASTADGSKVFFTNPSGSVETGSPIMLLDLNTNTLISGYSGTYLDAAVNADASVCATELGTANGSLNRSSIMAFEPYSADFRFHSVAGEKLNAGGTLLYVPHDQGVDLFDIHTGRLVQHVGLADGIPLDLDGMAVDETGTKMFVISNSGITIAELALLPKVATAASEAVSKTTVVWGQESGPENRASVTASHRTQHGDPSVTYGTGHDFRHATVRRSARSPEGKPVRH